VLNIICFILNWTLFEQVLIHPIFFWSIAYIAQLK
jgi:hypothetical protein